MQRVACLYRPKNAKSGYPISRHHPARPEIGHAGCDAAARDYI
ncbi:hypothetical protein C7S13_3198 [Burkholderia cepacia]|nr:hypothetical protein [Burkholderia cepacia]QOH34706.1 hypothetical protein C7S14_4599 [Burkholderia cepacia]